MMDDAAQQLQCRSSVWQRDDGWCHCGEPVAAVSVPEMAELGPATEALCVYCLPLRCDADPLNCSRHDWAGG